MENTGEHAIRCQLAELARTILKKGLVVRTWGNFSIRLDEDTFLITPSGRAYETMMPSDIVKVSIQTKKAFPGEKRKPSSETPIHAVCYRQRQKARVVLHTHQAYASILSLSPRGIAVKPEWAERLGSMLIPVSPYALPTTSFLHRKMEKTLLRTSSDVILMARHGALIIAENPEEALERADLLEDICREEYALILRREIADRENISEDSAEETAMYSFHKNDVPAESIVVSSDRELQLFKGKTLSPYLDDFAQICGVKIGADRKKNSVSLAEGNAYALCYGADEYKARSVRAVLEKNVRAAHIAEAFGRKPISSHESHLMRMIYQKKYSR